MRSRYSSMIITQRPVHVRVVEAPALANKSEPREPRAIDAQQREEGQCATALVSTTLTERLGPARNAVRSAGFIASAPFVLLRSALTAPLEGVRALVSGKHATEPRGPLRAALAAVALAAVGVVEGAARIPEIAVGIATGFADTVVRLFSGPSVRDAIELVLLLPIGALYAVASPFVEALRGADEGWFAPRRLTREEREVLACRHTSETLDEVSVHPSESWVRRLNAALLPGGGSMSVGDHVYAREGGMGTASLRHELVHVEQARATPGGTMAFLARYLADALAGRLAPHASGQWHTDSRYEDEAVDLTF